MDSRRWHLGRPQLEAFLKELGVSQAAKSSDKELARVYTYFLDAIAALMEQIVMHGCVKSWVTPISWSLQGYISRLTAPLQIVVECSNKLQTDMLSFAYQLIYVKDHHLVLKRKYNNKMQPQLSKLNQKTRILVASQSQNLV